jgi:hypothetical protein
MDRSELYKDARGEFRRHLKSGNGQPIATGGEGYSSKKRQPVRRWAVSDELTHPSLVLR